MPSKPPSRITVVLDEETEHMLDELRKEFDENQSKVIREAISFFYQHRETIEKYGEERIKFYTKMLSEGEHVILDLDHFTLFLRRLQELSDEDEFWKKLPKVAESHAYQLKDEIDTPEEYLERIEACNFFNLQKNSKNEFTLILNSRESKKFLKQLIKTTLSEMGYDVEVREDISKIRVEVRN